jgi:hypothetical protein
MKAQEFRKLIREEIKKVLKEEVDPNATYKINVGTSRGEFDPSDVKKVSGQPLTVAKAVMKMAFKDYIKAGYDKDEILEEYVRMFKLDEYTYFILTGEEDVAVVGSPKSKTYGEFWTLLDTDPEAAESMFEDMDTASEDADEIELGSQGTSGIGSATAKTQPRIYGANVGDVVTAAIGPLVGKGDFKVIEVYPDEKSVYAAIAKLPKAQGNKAKQWFEYIDMMRGPFAQIVPVKGLKPNDFPKFIKSNALVKK